MRFQPRRGAFEALARDVLEVGVDGVLGGNVELRERLLGLFQFGVAALRDVPGTVERIRNLAEDLQHLGLRLHVELLGVEAHPVRRPTWSCRSGCRASFRGSGRRLAQVVRVVGRHQRDSGVARQLVHQRHYDLVFLQFVILDLEEEVLLAEDIGVLVGEPFGFVVLLGS